VVEKYPVARIKPVGLSIINGDPVSIKFGYSIRTARIKGSEKPIVRVDPRYFRPTEVETLLGDPTKARQKLGWTPKVTFQELVAEMTREDLKTAERDELVKKHGYTVFTHNE
jgi:GDPmannose 4,6-dehydratase